MPATTSRPRSRALGWLALAALLVAMAAAAWLWRPRSHQPPSIILIVVDTLRADYLGAYGFKGPISPSIDQLAKESVLFENAFTQAPWTKPAIASLFTSLYPEQHGVLQHGGEYGDPLAPTLHSDALSQRAVTLAEVLHSAGYETAAFVANPWIGRNLGFAQGFEVFDLKTTGNDVPADAILARARTWLAERKTDRPFFLYLHFMDVHGPYTAPDVDFRAMLGSPGLGTRRLLDQSEVGRLRPYLLRSPWALSAEGQRLETWRGHYAGGVRAFDRQIGSFLDELRGSGVLDDALLIMTADHGEELIDHGGWDHGYRLYDEQMRIPLLVRRPGAVGGGRRIESLVNLIDLMPTIAAAAGASPPKNISGRDLSALIDGKASDGPPETAFAAGVKWQPEMRAVRTREEKLIQDTRTGETHLFDLEKDPLEQNDLAESEPERRKELEQKLAEHLQSIAAGPTFDADKVPVDPEVRRQLEALGYVGAEKKGESAPGVGPDSPERAERAKPEPTEEESP